MHPPGLRTGDRIVELAGLASTTAVVTGGVASGWIVWLIIDNWLTAIGAVIPGSVLGYVAARTVGKFLYRTVDGHKWVAKVGRASLPATIRAGLSGSMTAAVGVVAVGLVLFGVSDHLAALIGIAFGCGLVFGVVFACTASLS
jgi:hypothetical protein